jgi:hypothetical protein
VSLTDFAEEEEGNDDGRGNIQRGWYVDDDGEEHDQ